MRQTIYKAKVYIEWRITPLCYVFIISLNRTFSQNVLHSYSYKVMWAMTFNFVSLLIFLIADMGKDRRNKASQERLRLKPRSSSRTFQCLSVSLFISLCLSPSLLPTSLCSFQQFTQSKSLTELDYPNRRNVK